MAVDAKKWLEEWAERNFAGPGHVEAKSQVREVAKACAADALSAGLTIADLKEAACGDLEVWLGDRRNTAADNAMKG
jgi:hypothetical protein